MGNDGSSITRMMRGREKERRRRPRGRILSRQLAHYEQCMGEFNSGKSTIINALLGQRYLKEGVVPTTNEITLLLHSETESAKYSRCERNPDGQFICYLSSPILKQVAFLLYVQQWKKKVVFVLNELDLYRTSSELEEATSFVKEKARRLLNSVYVDCLFPVSAQSALDAKLSSSSYSVIETTKSRALKLTYSLLRLSNIDLIPAYALKAERTGSTFTISTFQNDIINPALSDARVCFLF
ncbi:probable transmembrane GTPase FZO-like, chloroplastic isoform X2 [Zingiber officinale]|uniref:probable transmembrane GTPase FZO-like, chloroplastic isoform X2 n=1 Tax=Zingiber officinale TaxID=94328 RepID=UPI001C4CEF0F|nr:probable transmembrane GTPase FZO-like, chloroplastic isoform X2 [Zingiber officinale]